MAQDSRLRSDSSEKTTSWKQTASGQSNSEIPQQHNVADVARTLVAYGGGSVAIDLALDRATQEAYRVQPLSASVLEADLTGWDEHNRLAKVATRKPRKKSARKAA